MLAASFAERPRERKVGTKNPRVSQNRRDLGEDFVLLAAGGSQAEIRVQLIQIRFACRGARASTRQVEGVQSILIGGVKVAIHHDRRPYDLGAGYVTPQ